MYSVKHAAAMTGISPDTLRMWERRYHVVEPMRSAGGYRLYDDAAVARLTAMRALVDAGWSPRSAAEQVMSGTTTGPLDGPLRGAIEESLEEPAPEAAPRKVRRGGGRELRRVAVDDLVRLAVDLDAHRVEQTLGEAFADDDFERLADEWLMPALHTLGVAWHRGEVTVAGEHFVSAAVHRRLAAAFDASPPNPSGPRVVVGLGRGSRHELGVLAFAVALRRAGLDVLYVGGDLPAETWVVTATAHPPDAVVIGVPSSDDVPAVRDTIAALKAALPDLVVFVGGGHQDRVGVGDPLGHSLGQAARDVARRLGAVRP